MLRASVIIANWNGAAILGECLDSLQAQTFTDFEVIVVDNGSTDGSLEMLKAYSGFARVVELDRNYGYSCANNRGIEKASGEFIVLLNNDTAADERWLEELVAAADAHPDCGMFSCRILNFDNRDTIDNIGHLFYPDGLNRGWGRLEKDDGRFDEPREALFPSGCAALYRKKALDEVGPLDEDFFAYGDDTDIGLRIRFAGWGCRYVPAAKVYHRYSATAGGYSPLKAYLVERNRIFVALKYLPLSMLLTSPWHTLKRLVLQAFGAISGRGAAGKFTDSRSPLLLVWLLIKADFAALIGAPKMLRKRRAYRKIRKMKPGEIRRLLKKFRISAKEIALKD